MAWIVPDWPAPSEVRALSTQRRGGVSTAPFASLNLGAHVGDSAEAVAENRRRLCNGAGLPAEPVWLSQQHGMNVLDLDGAQDTLAGADASFTHRPGRVCAILTADCLPVLLASDSGAGVAAAHAGWRGLAAGVIEATVRALGMPAQSLLAWLGPAIGPARFEIGAEVREALLCADPQAGAAFERNARGRYMADLATLARRRLERLGIARIYGGDACTYAAPEDYFSYRRDGRTGRQATLIWLENRP
jgi:purine-nucleoside/S-methyl-5'-thioadenosine phosphorylase / adenosine deaminase